MNTLEAKEGVQTHSALVCFAFVEGDSVMSLISTDMGQCKDCWALPSAYVQSAGSSNALSG